MSDKIIHSFQQRRQLTQALADLGQTDTEADLLEQVRRIARSYPSDLLVSTVVKHLDTLNSQLRGGLGHLAALLPPEEMVPALRAAAANREQSAQVRVTAGLLLERYLGEHVSPGLLADLNHSNEVAFQSLREAVEEGARNRHVLLEYVTQLHQTNEQIGLMVLDLLGRLEPAASVDLTRLLAQDAWPTVAASALARLERLAAEHDAALHALYTLQFLLPPPAAAQVERSLRKLQFSGRRPNPANANGNADGWRALLSPADLSGNFSIWFARDATDGQANGILIGVVLNLRLGVLQCFGHERITATHFPGPQPLGSLVTVRADNGQTGALLEAPPAVGRALLAQAQAAHWQASPARPLPDEYQLYGDWLWAFGAAAIAPEIAPEIASYLSADFAAALPPHSIEELDQDAAALLAHPACTHWAFSYRLMSQALGVSQATVSRLPAHEIAVYVLRELGRMAEQSQVVVALVAALRVQAVWLHVAGNPATAQIAQRLAHATAQLRVVENPLLLRLMVAGVRNAALGDTSLV